MRNGPNTISGKSFDLFLIDKSDTKSFNRHNYCILKRPRAINAVIHASLFAEYILRFVLIVRNRADSLQQESYVI